MSEYSNNGDELIMFIQRILFNYERMANVNIPDNVRIMIIEFTTISFSKTHHQNSLLISASNIILNKGKTIDLMVCNFMSNSVLPTSQTITCFLDFPINFVPFSTLINIKIHFRIKRRKIKNDLIKNMKDFTLLDWTKMNMDDHYLVKPRCLWFGLIEMGSKDWFKYPSMIPSPDNKWTDDHISQNSKVIMDLLLTFRNKQSKKRGITFTFIDKYQHDNDGYQYFFSLNKKQFSDKNFEFNRKWFIALQSFSKDIINVEKIEWNTQ